MDKDIAAETYILGIDTGGTYTDSVILNSRDKKLICKAKALTTKENLVTGIKNSIRKLDFAHKNQIVSVSLSTTLATNAIVEKKNCRVGLILIGKMLNEPLPAESVYLVQGRIDLHGNILFSVDENEIKEIVSTFNRTVDSIAVSGYLSIRNPSHELQVKQIIQEHSTLPVFCAHDLSGNLGYYERTITTILNAGLITIISDFLAAVKQALKAYSITAPIMVVKGDGTLMQEDMAVERPVDTVLSGPAASIIGAKFLTNKKEALVYDMGGTTSDIAIIENGSVYINPNGATVDCWQTHIRAANIYTFGVGGDSHIHVHEKAVRICSERVEPLCVAASKNSQILETLLKIEAEKGTSLPLYYKSEKTASGIRLNNCDKAIYHAISRPCSQDEMLNFVQKEHLESSLNYLVAKGLVIKTGMTPTDIKHIRGDYLAWDDKASILGAKITARAAGIALETLLYTCEDTIRQMIVDLCEEITETYDHNRVSPLRPIIGIGAPAAAWLLPAAETLSVELDIPPHSDVANAIGAALCPVSEYAEAIVRYQKEQDIYVLFMPDMRLEFHSKEAAEEYAQTHLGSYAQEKAIRAGGRSLEVIISLDADYVCGKYIQSIIRAVATDPRFSI